MKKGKRQPNYRELFLFGILMIIIGNTFIIIDSFPRSIGPVFLSVGALFMMASFRHKDKWMAGNKKGQQEEK